jgi:hypothetical protein
VFFLLRVYIILPIGINYLDKGVGSVDIKGKISRGEFDRINDEFVLNQGKHFTTQSILNKDQLDTIYDYLNNHKDEGDGQILTLNEQMLIRLSQEESSQFIEDLNQIRELYQ